MPPSIQQNFQAVFPQPLRAFAVFESERAKSVTPGQNWPSGASSPTPTRLASQDTRLWPESMQQLCSAPTQLAGQAISLKPLLQALGFFLSGMLLHRLPVRAEPGVRSLLPTDWKIFARVILGILSVHKINQAFQWQPPAWLGALEAVAVINPMAMGFSKKSLKQMLLIAPLVVAVVQAANFLNRKISEPLKEQCGIPQTLTRLGISLGFALLGVKLLPGMLSMVAKTGFLGKALKNQAQKSGEVLAGSAAMMTCGRGCTPGSVVCMSEVGEILGGMGNWFNSHATLNQQNQERR